MSRPAAMAEIHSAHAKPPAAIQKATMLPMPKTSQATNARAAGATKNPVVTTSIVDNPVIKQKMDFSTGRHQGAVHIPETIWPFGQRLCRAEDEKADEESNIPSCNASHRHQYPSKCFHDLLPNV